MWEPPQSRDGRDAKLPPHIAPKRKRREDRVLPAQIRLAAELSVLLCPELEGDKRAVLQGDSELISVPGH
jgi:hypothetical protein